jgi:hypothetical protein
MRGTGSALLFLRYDRREFIPVVGVYVLYAVRAIHPVHILLPVQIRGAQDQTRYIPGMAFCV